MMKQRAYWTAICVGILSFVARGAGPPEYEVTRATTDGGGVMRSTGDEYELSGTMGQPDAGVMEGGGFELKGGFCSRCHQRIATMTGSLAFLITKRLQLVYLDRTVVSTQARVPALTWMVTVTFH